jgi:hypothetical protein
MVVGIIHGQPYFSYNVLSMFKSLTFDSQPLSRRLLETTLVDHDDFTILYIVAARLVGFWSLQEHHLMDCG